MDDFRIGPDFMKVLEDNLSSFLEMVERFTLPTERNEIEISRFELIALLLIKQKRVFNMSALAQGLMIPLSTATGIAERLERKGLICRSKSAEDRRAINLELSCEGKELIRKYLAHLEFMITGWKSNLTSEEFVIFTILFRKMFSGGSRG